MFALDSTAHGLVDPTRTAAVSFCALSAVLFFLFFILLDGHNPRAVVFFFGLVGAAYGGHLDALAGAAPTYFALAVLGASLGLIASVVRYRHPIRSTFTFVTAAPFCGNSALFTRFIHSLCFCFDRYLRSFQFRGGDPLFDVRIFLHIQRRLLKLCCWWLHCRPHHSRAVKAVGCESDVSFPGNARCWNDKLRRLTGEYILAGTGAGRAGAIESRRRYWGATMRFGGASLVFRRSSPQANHCGNEARVLADPACAPAGAPSPLNKALNDLYCCA